MTHHREVHNVKRLIRAQWVSLCLVSFFAFFMGFGWLSAQNEIEVHIPPDLSQGASFNHTEIPKATVYTFAHYVFQQLNRWENNGREDYGKNIYRLAAYLTPAFREELQRDLKRRGVGGELDDRVRGVSEVSGASYEPRRVDMVRKDKEWVVWLDLQISESVRGMPIKRPQVRYPLRVVRYDVDRAKNPMGLALAGYANPGPEKLPEAKEGDAP